MTRVRAGGPGRAGAATCSWYVTAAGRPWPVRLRAVGPWCRPQAVGPVGQPVVQAVPSTVNDVGGGFVVSLVPMKPSVTEPDGAMVAV